jgi:lambda repressor-like predicted transcriptional regulator
LVAAPVFYVATNRHLKWLYSILVRYASSEEADTTLFANILINYLAFQKRWKKHESEIDNVLATVPLMIWRMRFSILMMDVKRAWITVRHKIRVWRSP